MKKTKVFRHNTGYVRKDVKKRKVFNKTDRILIANKTNFRCGYCGEDLPKVFHLDHIVAHARNISTCDFDNMMAACPQCNSFKSTFTIEEFRDELHHQVLRARKYSVNFRMSEKYKLIEVKKKIPKIKFYFETMGK